VHFTDVTKEIAPELIDVGLVCDMLWTDFDNDGLLDIMLAGEWMPLTILKNERARFRNITKLSGLDTMYGWWSSLCAGDFDNDGDVDYVAGNTGLNTFYKASKDHPVKIYAATLTKMAVTMRFRPFIFLIRKISCRNFLHLVAMT
jgi:hypothetical protein